VPKLRQGATVALAGLTALALARCTHRNSQAGEVSKMILRDILRQAGIPVIDIEIHLGEHQRRLLDYEVGVYEAGEQHDEVVHVEVVPEIKTILLEYE
jgi:hypothetical protein